MYKVQVLALAENLQAAALSLSLLFTSFLRFVMFSKSSFAVLVLGVTCAFAFASQPTHC